MNNPIFETKLAFNVIQVFPNYVLSKAVMGREQMIQINQITGITLGLFYEAKIVIETADGKKHKLLVKPKEKQALRDAIYGAMNA